MKKLIVLLLVLYPSISLAGVITCGDAMSLEGDARMALHQSAQKRAQEAIEEFTGKKLIQPYIILFGSNGGTPESTAIIVETYWCESSSTPLNAAYYGLYSSSKTFFEQNKLRAKPTRKAIKKQEVYSVSFGTGWAVSDSFVVTNYHVVAGYDKITLLRTDGTEVSAIVAMHDAANDLALLKVTDTSKMPQALHLASMPARIGDKVFTIGYPHPTTMGAKPKLTDGIVSAVTGVKDDPRTYQISVPLQAGNSGGPLLNMNGEVVGIVTAKLSAVKMFKVTGDLPQNVNYAVKSAYLSVLLSTSPKEKNGRTVSIKDDASLADLAESIKGSVMIVIAE